MRYRFEEEDYEHTYYLEDYYCTNPFCDCQHVTLSFSDQDNETNRIAFILNFTGTHNSLPNQPQLTALQTEIIKNFVKNLPPELMILFKQRYAEAKAHGENNPESYLMFEPGRYVNFLEFFPRVKEIFEFGKGENKYFVEDSYEMDPRNDNKDVQLAFYKLDIEAMDKKSSIFTYHFSFNEQEREKTDSALPESQSGIVLEFTSGNSNLVNLFKDRYRRVKALGEDLLKQAPKDKILQSNIHRNELCPCGSGKKFKRCCGEKLN